MELGNWINLNEDDKKSWLMNAYKKTTRYTNKDSVIINGNLIYNVNSFLCCFGESVNGPNGYFGHDLVSFYDCCFGGFGLTNKFKLTWENHLNSKKKLDNLCLLNWAECEIKNENYFDETGYNSLIKLKIDAINGYSMYENILEYILDSGASLEEA
jgi:hypothetical protein